MTAPATGAIRALFAFILLILAIAQIALSGRAAYLFEADLRPELDRRAQTIGLSVEDRIASAVELGIPFDRLQGVEAYFDQILEANPDIAFLALIDREKHVLHARGLSTADAQRLADGGDDPDVAIVHLPIQAAGQQLGNLQVGTAQTFIRKQIESVRLDILTVLATSMLIAVEVLRFVLSATVQGPILQVWTVLGNFARSDFRERVETGNRLLEPLTKRLNAWSAEIARRAANRFQTGDGGNSEPSFLAAPLGRLQFRRATPVVQIRILTFLFMFAEQLSRPFLPNMAQALVPSWAKSASDILAGLPITVFMLAVALSMPVAGVWSDRVGRRRIYFVGVAGLVLGLAGSALSLSYAAFVASRFLTALGYAAMYIACQGFVIDQTSKAERARGMSIFVGAIMVSEVCAPPIGGILAEQLGYHAVFALGAAVALLAAWLGRSVMPQAERRHPPSPSEQPEGQGTMGRGTMGRGTMGRTLVVLSHNWRFVAVVLLTAVPAKMLLTGFLFYLIPVLLADLGATSGETGRIIMAYGGMSLLMMPVFATLADKFSCHRLLVGGGGLLSGLGLLAVVTRPEAEFALIGVAALGLGQAMSIAPQLALVGQVCAEDCRMMGDMAVYGIFRMLERFGSALGPLVAGSLAALYGAAESAAILGGAVLVASTLFLLIFARFGRRTERVS